MKTDIKGCSTCGEGQESHERFYSDALRRSLIQYDYRTPSGELFSCVARDLEDARTRRDKWLENKKEG